MAGKKRISANFMDIVFVPNPERQWKEEAGRVVIDVENKGFYHWIAQKFFHRPRVSHISLDAHGTALWKELDGEKTVNDLVMIMTETFPGEEERMLDRVVTYLGILQNNHYIIKK
jgi:hypothetical protein